tara:strand:- start:27 stop:185 length:159 start_codon:yes stop_codon:yes gene_type:complete
MKKSIKIALGVGVVVVGYFLYKKNKDIVMAIKDSKEEVESYNEKLDKNEKKY